MQNNYFIPPNYTDAGKIFGMFEIRNTVEAVTVAVPLFFLCMSCLPFDLTMNIIVTIVVVLPLGGFALIGINDDCLSRFVAAWWRWFRRRGVITFNGAELLRKGRAYR